jgi:hypothetical protein
MGVWKKCLVQGRVWGRVNVWTGLIPNEAWDHNWSFTTIFQSLELSKRILGKDTL